MSDKYNGPRNDMTCVSDLVYDLLDDTLVTMNQAIKDVDVPVLNDGSKDPEIWDKLSILCQESKFLRESLTGVAHSALCDAERYSQRSRCQQDKASSLAAVLSDESF